MAAGFAGVLAGCFSTPEGLDSPDPNARVRAIIEAASIESDSFGRPTAAGLVAQLESIDPAARMLAIRTLERHTGTTLGFDHAGGDVEQRAAIYRWRAWLRAWDPAIPNTPPPLVEEPGPTRSARGVSPPAAR